MRIARFVIVLAIVSLSFWVALQVLNHWNVSIVRPEITPVTNDDVAAAVFRVGAPVVRDGKEAWLVTAVGLRMALREGAAPNSIVGWLTGVVTDSSGTTTLEGWAVDEDERRPASQVVATVADRIWVSGLPANPRPDITVLV